MAHTPDPQLVLDSGDPSLFDVRSRAAGPAGSLPFTAHQLKTSPSGNLFGWTMNAGMGWDPAKLGGPELLILTRTAACAPPTARPSPSVTTAATGKSACWSRPPREELKALGAVPFAGFCTDPCDGRTQGTTGMFDSLPYRNDAATVFRRLIRSLPTRCGVLGVATCDKGLPAMMMALA